MQILLPFALSFLIGLLLGIERERSHPAGTQAIGVRTFVLFALLGTTAVTLKQPLITIALCFFVFGMLIVSYFQTSRSAERHKGKGITTEIAGGMVFLLGYMVKPYPLTTITVSAVILLILVERKRLHILSREKIRHEEIEALIILAIFGIGILPLLPNRTIDPWNLFNPRNFGILITVIACIQFLGYAAIRLFGQNFGRAVIGFFGGLVSSTAVFATLRDNLNDKKFENATMASGILATTAMIAEFAVILLFASPILLGSLVWPLLTMISVAFLIAGLLIYKQTATEKLTLKQRKPLKLKSVIISAIFIGLILLAIATTKRYLGADGIQLISFLGALFELHGVALATALLYLDSNISLQEADNLLLMALLAGFVSKFILLGALTPSRFALKTSALLSIILVSGGLVFLLL